MNDSNTDNNYNNGNANKYNIENNKRINAGYRCGAILCRVASLVMIFVYSVFHINKNSSIFILFFMNMAT